MVLRIEQERNELRRVCSWNNNNNNNNNNRDRKTVIVLSVINTLIIIIIIINSWSNLGQEKYTCS